MVDGIHRAPGIRKAGITQGDGEFRMLIRLGRRIGPRTNSRLAIEHLQDAPGARARLGEYHYQVGDIDDRQQSLRHVVDERHHLALRKSAGIHLQTSHPQNRADGEIHHEKRRGVEHTGELSNGDGNVCLLIRRMTEALTLVTLPHKCAHHASARQALARKQADAIELLLHALEIRDAAGHHEPENTADEWH